MAHVGVACFGDGVVVPVDDAVEVARHAVGDLKELVVVKRAVFLHKLGNGDRRQVAHGHFVRCGVFDDLCAEVGRPDGAQILLVGLAVGGVLVEHVWRAGFHLAFQHFEPEVLGLNGLPSLAFHLVLGVQRLELCAPSVRQSGAFVGAHEGPIAVLFHSLHEQVGRPKGVEQIAGALLFFSVVLAKLEEVKDVGMPRLDVNGKGTFALSASLVHVTCRVVEDTKHWDDAVGGAVGSFDVGSCGADVVDGQADASSVLRNFRALLQGVVDAGDAVLLHGEQEAAGHLRLGRSRIE